MSIYRLLQSYQCISIIGIEKNTGKTVALNKIIQETAHSKILGISSIGRDGEEIDVVTNTDKPRIYIFSGTIIATARKCLESSDITKEILYCTGISSPMGEVIIIKALSDGYVEVAGGSYNEQNISIIKKMKEFGCNHIILDGALSRNSSAVLTDAVVLATGAAVSSNINTVVNQTRQAVQSLSFPSISPQEKEEVQEFFKHYSLGIRGKNKDITPIQAIGIVAVQQAIKKHLDEDTCSILIRSAITDIFIEHIIKHRRNFKQIECIITDGTKCMLSYDNYCKALACGIYFKVLNPLNLVCVTFNPYSPKGNYFFDNTLFREMLQSVISVPVINVRDKDDIN